jgi:hypothetical protein
LSPRHGFKKPRDFGPGVDKLTQPIHILLIHNTRKRASTTEIVKGESMKTRIACGVVVSLFLIVGLAVAGEEKEPEQIVMLEEYAVHPEDMAQFEASFKTIQAAATEHGLDFGWDVYASDDMRYTLTFWVDGLAGIDAMSAKWKAFTERWGEEALGEWNKAVYPTYDHSVASLWHPRADLSYLPENAPKENDFFYWGVITIKPGHMDAVEKSFKDFVKLYTEHEVANAWRTAVGGIGTEGPVIAYLEWGASAGAFYSRLEGIEANEELQEASGALWAEMVPHIRGNENTTGKYRKDLSWHPEKKAAATKEE